MTIEAKPGAVEAPSPDGFKVPLAEAANFLNEINVGGDAEAVEAQPEPETADIEAPADEAEENIEAAPAEEQGEEEPEAEATEEEEVKADSEAEPQPEKKKKSGHQKLKGQRDEARQQADSLKAKVEHFTRQEQEWKSETNIWYERAQAAEQQLADVSKRLEEGDYDIDPREMRIAQLEQRLSEQEKARTDETAREQAWKVETQKRQLRDKVGADVRQMSSEHGVPEAELGREYMVRVMATEPGNPLPTIETVAKMLVAQRSFDQTKSALDASQKQKELNRGAPSTVKPGKSSAYVPASFKDDPIGHASAFLESMD